MYQNLLFANRFKRVGWFLLTPSLLVGVFLITTHYEPAVLNVKIWSLFPSLMATENYSWIHANLANTITGIIFIAGGILVGFSKERDEDEYIANLRLSALLWAVLINYTLLLLAFICVYEFAFFTVMIYNMFTVLLLFIARFQFLLYRNAKILADAE